MKIYTKDEVRQMPGLDNPQSELCHTPQSTAFFTKHAFKHTLCAQPIRWGLQIVALVAFVLWGFFTHHWTPLLIFGVLTIVLRGLMLYNFVRLHRTLRRGPCHYRIDKYGISLVIKVDDEGFVRSITDSWQLVRMVFVYKDFVVIKMEKAAEGADEYYLFGGGKSETVSSILGFWRQAIRGVVPEQLPDLYSPTEISEMSEFIENRFGEIECIGHETVSDNLHIDLAIIKPSPEHPYFTVCTIGAGAYRMNVPVDDRLKHGISEYNEYVIHLPADWNVLGDGSEKEENWWPLRMLKKCARGCMEHDCYFACNMLYSFDAPADASTTASAAFFDYPLPDIDCPAKMNLSTGRTVNFLQVIPLNREEADCYDDIIDYAERYLEFFDIDIDDLEDASDEERIQTFSDGILKHFASLTKKEDAR